MAARNQAFKVLLERSRELAELKPGAQLGALHNLIEDIRAGEPVEALNAVFLLRRWLDLREFEMVHAARDADMSWSGVATLLGKSKQTVWQKYGYPGETMDD